MEIYNESYEAVQLGQIWTNKKRDIVYTVFKLKENIFDKYDVYTYFHYEKEEFSMGGCEKFIWESDFLSKMNKLRLSVSGFDKKYCSFCY